MALQQAGMEFRTRISQVTLDGWDRPTPCDEWDVRALVNHVVGWRRGQGVGLAIPEPDRPVQADSPLLFGTMAGREHGAQSCTRTPIGHEGTTPATDVTFGFGFAQAARHRQGAEPIGNAWPGPLCHRSSSHRRAA